jgi:hypothetical protein
MPAFSRPRPAPADDRLLILLSHDGEELARELAVPRDALRIAMIMLLRRERLQAGDVLKVLHPDLDGTPLPPPRAKHA